MWKMNYRFAPATLLLGLCLALLGSACTSRSGELQVHRAATELGIAVDKDARVADIYPDKSFRLATELGLQVGDVVLAVNDVPVSLDPQDSGYDLDSVSEVSVKVLRKGEEIVLITLNDRQAEIQAADAELNEMFEGRTEEEVDALFEKYFVPYDPKTAEPTATPYPQSWSGL